LHLRQKQRNSILPPPLDGFRPHRRALSGFSRVREAAAASPLPALPACGTLAPITLDKAAQVQNAAKDARAPMTTKSTRAACGIRVVASSLATEDAIAAARTELAGGVFQHIIVFFSIEHDPEVLLAALKNNFQDTPVS